MKPGRRTKQIRHSYYVVGEVRAQISNGTLLVEMSECPCDTSLGEISCEHESRLETQKSKSNKNNNNTTIS